MVISKGFGPFEKNVVVKLREFLLFRYPGFYVQVRF